MRWGFVPFWAKDVAIVARMINARSETIATAPAFRAAFKKMRCLIPASGFSRVVETRGRHETTHAYRHEGWRPVRDGGSVVALGTERRRAARDVHDRHRRADQLCEPFHDRMPVISDAGGLWAVARCRPARRRGFTAYLPGGRMRAYPVSTRVNSPKNDDAAIIEPIA